MLRTTRRPAGRKSAWLRLGLATGVALGLAGIVTPSGAEEGESPKAEVCPPGLERMLERAQDNFASACLPGADFASMDDSGAELAPGEMASSPNLSLVHNIPKQAPLLGTNSDLAFKGKYAYAGNYDGFTVYDLSDPAEPAVVKQFLCPGSQNDVSVWGDILVLSVDSSRNDDSCASTTQSASVKESWEGVRVFDISNPADPAYVASVETDCGSHTHTLAPTKDGRELFVYVSSYNPNASFPDCQPPHDKISIVKIPVASPADAALVGTPVLFPDGGSDGTGYSRATAGCHDITAYPSKDIAAGACMGDGILLDITDRANPVVTERVQDQENFAFWHSATFNNKGTKVVFTDELGGGGAATCNPTVGDTKGANGIYDIVDGELVFGSYYKIPRTQSNTENCVAHNGSLIPVKGRDWMVQAWYQGGISVFDFTDSTNPREIAWFDRGPVSTDKLTVAGSWSAYWYNGYIYSNDIQQGFDVLKLDDPRAKTAYGVTMDTFNPQSQPSYN
ncbi:LVIVD repeat-containing protein [Nocardioides sp. GCM10027113]|uniref:LVIVD repeat-containing protein n=1 Tax=unclassified Nocardioides TaxID=2615069 RepID=UPI00360E0147